MNETPSLAETNRLMLLAKQGDEECLGALLERYRAYLELLARMQLGRGLQDKIDAADLVQETFLEAHRGFEAFRGVGERVFVAWLRKILARQMSRLIRRFLGARGRDVRRERRLEQGLDRSSRQLDRGLFAPGSSPSHQASRREQGVLLANMLAQLPEDYREVLVLRHFEELTFPEISDQLGRSIESVQKIWVRALAKLRQQMGATL
ncbi:MAG: sigma-70 family RNA polymerase sigma factor [Pirellulales bacterium]|nr:sigma-70 family RNA polymerase sigma factor [Pirellulales bacterium]